jgi:Zn finger protein HypA/HybF involved in hydrogenase expression
MQISRPTLTRIYERARTKFATALVEGCILLIEGGDIKLKSHVFLCEDCGSYTETDERFVFHCRQCNSPHVVSLDECYQRQCRGCGKCKRGGRNARI